MAPTTYIYELTEERERTAVERWMFGHGPELLADLGLPLGWWCGLCLDRKDVFSDGSDGDVDLVAGPLSLGVSAEELRERVRAAQDSVGPQFALPLALKQVGEEGLIVWPPPIEFIVASEIKSSWFDGTTWKARHAGAKGQRRILGNLNQLRKRGVNNVSLLQLGATMPTSDWTKADALLDRALQNWPVIIEPESLGDHGYYRALMAPALEWTEAIGGVHDGLDCLKAPIVVNGGVRQPWHDRLQERLSRMPKPRYFRTFIHPCRRCRRWRHAGSATIAGAPCDCGGSNGERARRDEG